MAEMEMYTKLQENKVLLVPVFIGILGYFFFFSIPMFCQGIFEQQIWSQLFTYNQYLDWIPLLQKILVVIGSSIGVGYFSARVLTIKTQAFHDTITIGIISGLTYGILYVWFNIVSIYIIAFRAIAREVIFNVFIQIFVALVLIVLFQILGAYFFFKQNTQTEGPDKSQEKNPNHTGSVIISIIIVWLALSIIIVLPIGISFYGIQTGLIEWKPNCGMLPDQVSVERIDENTVKITQITQSDCYSHLYTNTVLPHQKSPSWMILINDQDFSNKSIIVDQGFADSIEPSVGLSYGQGSFVVINGPSLFSNRTNFCTFKIIESFPSGATQIILKEI